MLVTFVAVGAACAPAGDSAASEYRVELGFEPSPPRIGPATCKLRLLDAAGAPVLGAVLELEGNMNHAGMVPVFAHAVERGPEAPGEYSAPFEFTMGGDWFVIVTGEVPGGGRLEELHLVPGVSTEAGASAAASDACCELGELGEMDALDEPSEHGEARARSGGGQAP